MPSNPTSAVTRWLMVAVALGVTASAFTFINGVAFLIPALEDQRGTPLTQAGLLSVMPSFGMVVTLVAWGYVMDHVGERNVLIIGSALTAAAGYAAASVHSMVAIAIFLFLGGMAAASCNPASGALVSGWFPWHQRGLAMGIRQTAQPLGIGLGAFAIPKLAEHSAAAGFMFPAVMCAVSTVVSAFVVVDPPRKPRSVASQEELASPYHGTTVLWRIHAVAALTMMPQCVIVTFMLVWLVKDHHWSVTSAGSLVAVAQLLGALSRVAAGRWSDLVGSRMRPVRIIALATAVAMLILALTDHVHSPLVVALMVTASVIAVSDNGLEATAITEFAGPFWSGRALGAQNTIQRVTALAGPPMFAAVISTAGYPLAFALCALFPLAAAPIVPAGLLPPGLDPSTQRPSVRRQRRWTGARLREWPAEPPRAGPPRQRRRLRRREEAAAPPT